MSEEDLTLGPEQRIGAAQFSLVLRRAGSPAGPPDELADMPDAYGLDRAVALAFFAHESGLGLLGVTAQWSTMNWGNLRRGPRAVGRTPHPFAIYASWADGLRDWCELIANRYVGGGLSTLSLVVPVYAPGSDGNSPARYIARVLALVARWRAEEAGRSRAGQFVVSVRAANLRAGAGRSYAVVGRLAAGDVVDAEAVVTGETVGGDFRWLRLGPRRYIHRCLVRRA